MKARNKKLAATSLALIIGTSAFATVLQADTITKSLKATFNNIKVTLDGTAQQPNFEPFMVDNTVYVSLRDAGQMTGNEVTWDGTNKTVQIKSGNKASSTELANANAQIANLKVQVAQLQTQLAKYESVPGVTPDTNLKSTLIKKTLQGLEDDYSDKNSIKWAYDLTESNGKLNLEMSFERRYSSTFNDLSESRIKTLLTSICSYVQKNHPGVEINGSIFDGRENDIVLNFTCNSKGSLSINYGTTQYALDRMADDLIYSYKKLPEITYGSLKGKTYSIGDIELEYDKRRDELIFKLYTDISLTKEWDDLVDLIAGRTSGTNFNNANLDELEEFLYDISDDIYDEFDVDSVSGMIYNTNGSNDGVLIVKFQDETLSLRAH